VAGQTTGYDVFVRERNLEPVDELVYEEKVAGKDRMLHRTCGDGERLDDEGAYRENDEDNCTPRANKIPEPAPERFLWLRGFGCGNRFFNGLLQVFFLFALRHKGGL